ncbi:MAG: tRNA-dihydrouridine synthase family protein [Clostridiales bacterium]|nr:tRNA-dihydrouridine synthase family protein [Clostridiales bacterium]
MQVKSLTVGNLTLSNNLFLAPMAGYTDYPFRTLASDLGYGLCFTELVSAKGLVYGGKGSKELLATKNYATTAAQFFGSDAFFMRSACESEDLKDYKIVDINMGCPVPKVYRNGEGSALLCDVHKAENIVKECVKSGKIITVKIRTGLKKGDDIAKEFAQMAENSGASLITIHGRVREDYYSGTPDYNAIYRAKQSVKIPVIANGGLFTIGDCDKMIEETGADGVMIARGGIADPFLACKILDKNPPFSLKEFMLKQLLLMQSFYGEERSYKEFRKFVPYYFKGVSHSKELRLGIQSAGSVSEIQTLINNNL